MSNIQSSRYSKKGIYKNYLGYKCLQGANAEHFKMHMQSWHDNNLITDQQLKTFTYHDFLRWCEGEKITGITGLKTQ